MLESDDLNKLYEWINKRYEQMTNGEITEETYLKELEYYKGKLGSQSSEENKEEETEKTDLSQKLVRSTSIAGLRKKLMDELGK